MCKHIPTEKGLDAMFFIVVFWTDYSHGFTTRKDFEAAVYEVDFQHAHGYNAELWMFDAEGKWYRIDFVNNDKHVPYAKPIG